MQWMHRNCIVAFLSFLSLAVAMPGSAATIAWSWTPYVNTGPGLNVMGIDQFDQSGFKFLAVNLGAQGPQTLVQSVDPDIVFTGSDPNFSVVGGNLSLSSPAGTFHDDLGGNNNISGSAVHSDFLGGEIAPVTFRLSNLVIGRVYSIQTLMMDFNAFVIDVYFDGGLTGSFGEDIGGGVNGHRGIGAFTADSATQDFTILVTDSLNNPRGALLNAIYVQSRTIPEPSAALLAGLLLGFAGLRRSR